MHKPQKTAPVLFKALLCGFVCSVLICAPAFGATVSDQTSTDGVLTRTWDYRSSEGIPEIPDSIEQGGQTLYVQSKTDPKGSANGVEYKSFSYAEMRPIPLTTYNNGAVAIRKVFPAAHHIDETPYSGDILLKGVATKAILESVDRKVDKTLAIEDLPSNEVEGLPTTHAFTVSSDSAVGATTTKVLDRAGVEFKITGTDQYGIPNKYTAILTFRGLERYLTTSYYEATATYSGQVPNRDTEMVISAVYASKDATLTPTTQSVAPVTVEKQSAPKKSNNWLKALIAALAALAAGAIIVVVYASNKNAKLVGHNDEKYAKLHIRKTKDVWTCDIKKRVILMAPDSPSYHVIPRTSLAQKKKQVKITVEGTVLYEGDLQERCTLDLEAIREIRTANATQTDGQ